MIKSKLEEKKKSIIKGEIASKGQKNIYIATACVIHSSSEWRKVKKGEILVTSMTTPDFVTAMKKALGFITDEGALLVTPP